MTWDSVDEHAPRFVGNTHAISFLSARGDKHDSDQLWLMPMDGGEARKLTSVRDGVNDYSWSPDGTRAVLALDDSSVDGGQHAASRSCSTATSSRPMCRAISTTIARISGSSTSPRSRSRSSRAATTTRCMPEWSPDGSLILFSSKQQKDPDRTDNWDVYVIAPTPGATARQLTHNDLDDDDPQWESRAVWSPDSKEIAFLQGGPDSLIYFALQRLAVVPAAGGPVRVVSRSLDRSFVHPAWSGRRQVDLRAARGRRLDDSRARRTRWQRDPARARRSSQRCRGYDRRRARRDRSEHGHASG